MPAIIDVTYGHPLHPAHCFWQKLPMGEVDVTSLQMGYQYFFLQHHRQPEAAEKLVTDAQLLWNPPAVFDHLIRPKVPKPNVNFVIHQVDIIRSVMLYQLQCKGSPFVEALENELQKIDPADRGNIEFRVYSNSERILASGHPYGHWAAELRGFHHYADLLNEVTQIILQGKEGEIDNSLFQTLNTNYDLYMPYQEKSLLLVTDSQGKFFDTIIGGDVVPVGGGNFRHILKVFGNPELDIHGYKWIIVYCGTNCRASSRYGEKDREFQWRNLREVLVQEAAARGKDGSIVYCNSFEHPYVDVSPGLANQVERDLCGTGIQCINWQRIGNPFLLPNGQPKPKLYDTFNKRSAYDKKTEIHLNHAGLTILWKTWADFIPALKYLPMTVSAKKLTIPKYLAEEPPELPLPTQPPFLEHGDGSHDAPTLTRLTPGGNGYGGNVAKHSGYEYYSQQREERPSTSGVSTRGAEVTSTVTALDRGAKASTSRKRTTPAETDADEYHVTMERPRDSSECRVFYEKEGRYTPSYSRHD